MANTSAARKKFVPTCRRDLMVLIQNFLNQELKGVSAQYSFDNDESLITLVDAKDRRSEILIGSTRDGKLTGNVTYACPVSERVAREHQFDSDFSGYFNDSDGQWYIVHQSKTPVTDQFWGLFQVEHDVRDNYLATKNLA